ncbi:hypothetical protein KIW84_044322 [Lathyrus oleraceus]|uniref:Uncharacterized protein n=1 Tax=Pisum sativum TaxID=3888 RepID=A0A9D4XG31_PEA|nr:hypothetical protein KIW84_044322 [Pisum sativum]
MVHQAAVELNLLLTANVEISVDSVEPKTISAQPLVSSGSEESLEKKPEDDKHNCPFDYRTAGRDAIAKSSPVVKAEKLDKI